MSGDDQTPRRPRNMQGLLQFCLSATSKEDAPGDYQPRPMSSEEKSWLEEALKAAVGNDPVKRMIEDIKVLSNIGTSEESSEDAHIAAMEELTMYCEDIDLAQDYYKIGGYALLPKLLEHNSSEIRWRAADLIATLVQNNPFCQKAALELNLMELVLKRLAEDDVELVKIKALYAVSCMSRECEEAQTDLIKHDGLSSLIKAMQTDCQKLQIKAAFLMAYLCSTSPAIKSMLTDMGAVEQLVSLLQAPHAPHHEHIMASLRNLVSDNSRAVEECQRPQLQLRELLEKRLQLLKGKEEYEEEENSCKEIINMCFKDSEEPDK